MSISPHAVRRHVESCLCKLTKIQYHIQLLKQHGERSSILEAEYESTMTAKRVFEQHLRMARENVNDKKH